MGIFLAVFALFVFQAAHAQAVTFGDAADARIETHSGPVRGIANSNTIAFLGIPYAEPPVGALRWQPPKPRRPWQRTLDATHFGKHCPNLGVVLRQANASEDCLFLNVYVPKKAWRHGSGVSRSRLPVMVWIHGGANVSGASEFYDPTPLVEIGEGVVVVTMNYRLGPLGFLAHPALDAEGHAAVNYGVMDQQLALKWVRENIEAFAGDARNVTIFGESSGGLDVTTHLISPLSAGLFDRAIIQSGAYELDTPALAQSEELGLAFAKRAGCADQTAACLRALSADRVIANAGEVGAPGSSINQSTVDGRVLPESQRAALEAGRVAHVADSALA
jgi:para-nitrobenzyl esterase